MMKRVGIVGGGQLARMMALAAHPLNIRCRVLDPSEHPPAADVAEHVRGALDDPSSLARLARGCDVVTYELEQLASSSLEDIASVVPVRPGPRAVAVASDRWIEKRFLRERGLETAPFALANSPASVEAAVAELGGGPCVMKTRTQGYDGRGQSVIRQGFDASVACELAGGSEWVVEGFVAFDRELSITAVRSVTGEIRAYPIVENHHQGGILAWSLAPAPDRTNALQRGAEAIANAILSALDYVGVLTVELFQCGSRLLVNEIAPRVHNSGHWTIEGAATSQFENHLRAVLALPLGSTAAAGVSVLVNILGELPAIEEILALPDTHLHLYNKPPRPRRKIGHVTSRTSAMTEARERLAMLLSISKASASGSNQQNHHEWRA